MRTNQIQKIGQLAQGQMAPDERGLLLAELAEDEEAIGLLGILGLPEFSEENLEPPPFLTGKLLTIGCVRNFFLLPEESPFQVIGRGDRLTKKAQQILTETSIPHLFLGDLEISLPLSDGSGSLVLRFESVGGEIGGFFSLDSSKVVTRTVEISAGGEVIQKISGEGLSDRQLRGVEIGRILSLRVDSDGEGCEVLLAPMELTQEEWRSAALVACLVGNLVEAIRIFRDELEPVARKESTVRQIRSFLETLSSRFRVENSILVPVPATRGDDSGPGFDDTFNTKLDATLTRCLQTLQSDSASPVEKEESSDHFWSVLFSFQI